MYQAFPQSSLVQREEAESSGPDTRSVLVTQRIGLFFWRTTSFPAQLSIIARHRQSREGPERGGVADSDAA